jgi:hypothetical protein
VGDTVLASLPKILDRILKETDEKNRSNPR